jgi:hypothetical protein
MALGGSALVGTILGMALLGTATAREPGVPDAVLERARPAKCAAHTYSTCPDRCVRQCVPSWCEPAAGGGMACTLDCEGPGSCRPLVEVPFFP